MHFYCFCSQPNSTIVYVYTDTNNKHVDWLMDIGPCSSQ